MKTCLLYNAGAGAAVELAQRVDRFAKHRGVEIRRTGGQTDMRELVRRAVDEGTQRLVVAGGDGTISRVVNCLAGALSHVELAVIPAGTGNDLARSLALPLDDVDAACRLAMEGDVARIDVVRVQCDRVSYFVNVANGGIGGQVAVDIQQSQKAKWGVFAYWLESLSHLVAPTEHHLTMQLDHQSRKRIVLGLALANGRCIGGGFPIAPDAVLDDGLLDVTMLSVPIAADLLNLGLRSVAHLDDSTSSRCARVHIRADPPLPFSIDGEPLTAADATFEVLPRSLQMVAGKNAALRANLPEDEQTAVPDKSSSPT